MAAHIPTSPTARELSNVNEITARLRRLDPEFDTSMRLYGAKMDALKERIMLMIRSAYERHARRVEALLENHIIITVESKREEDKTVTIKEALVPISLPTLEKVEDCLAYIGRQVELSLKTRCLSQRNLESLPDPDKICLTLMTMPKLLQRSSTITLVLKN